MFLVEAYLQARFVSKYTRARAILEDTQSEAYRIKIHNETTLLGAEALYKAGVLPPEEYYRIGEQLQRAKTESEISGAISNMNPVPPENRFHKLGESPKRGQKYEIVYGEEEMLDRLNRGWELVRELNDGNKFLMKKS